MWSCAESRSGWGSTLDATGTIANALPGLVSRFRVERLLDAPCGDFNWLRHVELPKSLTYIGADVVPAIADANKARYACSQRRFMTMDIINDALPEADLLFCRDCLIHFSDDDIFMFLDNFMRSSIEYLMTTTYKPNGSDVENRNIVTGDFRALDLFKVPFQLPGDVLFRADDFAPGAPPREMCIWSRAQIGTAVGMRRG
jgi:hypothetical protein